MQTRSFAFSLLALLMMAAAPACSSDEPGGPGHRRPWWRWRQRWHRWAGRERAARRSSAGTGWRHRERRLQRGAAGAGAGGSTGAAAARPRPAGPAVGPAGRRGGGSAATGGSGGGSGDAARDDRPDGPGDVSAETPGSNGGPFTLTSSVFKEGEVIERMYRCRTENISPPFSWTPGPAGTKSYAIMMHHMQAPALDDVGHPGRRDQPAGGHRPRGDAATPAGAKQAKPNVDGSNWYGYSGPCPGSPNRQYDFDVYALDVATLARRDARHRRPHRHHRRPPRPLAHARLSGRASP